MKPDRNLDILRALAVLVVLVAHCFPASLPQQAAGHYAVLIFFVHTALVLLLSLERQSGVSALPLRFYIQRIFRIYPLSILCVLVTLAFRISWPDSVFTPRSGLSIGANLLLVQNFLSEPRSISPPMRSLPFEVQMYAVLPPIFWFIRTRGMQGAVILTIVSVLLALVELVARPLGGQLILNYGPCFMGGVLAFCACGARRRLPYWLWPVLVAALGVFYWGSGQNELCAWLACMALGLMVPRFHQAPPNLVSKAAGLVARYSYGIYLAHAPLLWLCFQKFTGLHVAARWVVFAVLISIVPVALYHLLEEPLIRTGKAISSRLFPRNAEACAHAG